MVGLGGGSLAKFVYHRLPETASEVLEINPQVVAVARRMFEVPAGDGRFTVRVCDGAEFIARDGPGYDAILVDGYDGDSQVEALSSRAFYAACRRRLDAGGVLVVNLWGSDRAFDDYLERIESAFPGRARCACRRKAGQRHRIRVPRPAGQPALGRAGRAGPASSRRATGSSSASSCGACAR